jgi:hypothetical protein
MLMTILYNSSYTILLLFNLNIVIFIIEKESLDNGYLNNLDNKFSNKYEKS